MSKAALKQAWVLTAFLLRVIAFSANAGIFPPTSSSVTVSGNFTLCAGWQTTLIASGADYYNWSNGPNTASFVVSPLITTSYTVTGHYNNGDISKAIITVTVLARPNITISGTQTICTGESATLQASGAVSYSWSNGQSVSVITITPTATMVYSVSGTDANGCDNSAAWQVKVNAVPVVSLNDATLCAGSQAALTASALPSDGTTYLWQPGGGTLSSIVVSPTISTHYTVTATSGGCSNSSMNSVLVMPVSAPVTDFSYKQPVCLNDTTANPLADVAFSPGGTFSSDQGLSINDSTGNIDPTKSTAGIYLVTYTIGAHHCITAGSGTTEISVLAPPQLTVSPDITISPGDEAQLSASGGTTYSWMPTTSLSCSNCAQPTATPAKNTRYCVLTTSAGCTGKACITVFVGCDQGDFSLPNAFTPNGDGYNDEFCLQGWDRCIDKFKVMIFDRWGEKVYESTNPSFCWDGRFNGRLLETDVVVYTVSASFTDGTSVSRKGNITLVR